MSGSKAQSASFPSITYDVAALEPLALAPATIPAIKIPDAGVAVPAATDGEAEPAVASPVKAATVDPAALECMAKIVHHEARNQPRKGQIAVAQTLLNRIKAGRFGETVCAVASQHGQFFDIDAYRPAQDSATWANAIDVSRAVLSGAEDADGVAPGAMYFRAAYHPASGFFRTRQRVGSIGDHIFYR